MGRLVDDEEREGVGVGVGVGVDVGVWVDEEAWRKELNVVAKRLICGRPVRTRFCHW